MPALPSVPKTLRFELFWTYGEDTFAKSRYFMTYTGAAPTNTDLATMANAVMTAASSHLAPLMSANVALKETIITDLSSPSAATGSSTTAAVTGTRSGNGLPADTSLLESKHIQRRFRGGHARVYWPFGVQNDLFDNQTWTTTFVSTCTTDLLAYYTAVVAAVWSGGGTLAEASISYYEGFTNHTGTTGRTKPINTPRATPILDAVIGAIVQLGVASIRKRLLGLA